MLLKRVVAEMYEHKRISKVYRAAKQIPFDDDSKIILMSDCHRGDGSWADDFSDNQNLYFAALTHYYQENYTYIELGDGDEIWENKRLSDIIDMHSDAFWLLSRFYRDGRLYFIYGNHDIVKKNKKLVQKDLYSHFDQRKKKSVPLFPKVEIYEGLILQHRESGNKIFLLHGHQGDFLNDTLWRLSRFLVRHVWKPLELKGVRDPTSPAKNNEKKDLVEKRLASWVKSNRQMLIAGHTHRPVFPGAGKLPYFNDGSCVHPRCITGIEITGGCISLIKWNVKTKKDGTLYVGKEVLAGPRKLNDCFRDSSFR